MSSRGARAPLERDDEGDWIDAELLAMDGKSEPDWRERVVAAVRAGEASLPREPGPPS